MADRVGQQLGNYRLVRLLGRGGFAEVYLGQHVHLASKQAAIKILQLFDVDARKFQEEAETTEKLVHPHIVRLLDFDIEQGTPFLVLDYAPGGSLRTRHPKGSMVSLARVGEYLKEIAPALQYAHDQHILHRDMKPDNLLIGRQGDLLLSDFGIAVITQTGRTSISFAYGIGGTPYYMAPETYQGRPEKASDQYALAVVVYEWLCGSVPFSEGNFIQVGYQHAHEPVPPLCSKNPTIPAAIETVVLKALSKEPKDRFGSVQAFANALEQASQPTIASLSHAPIVVPPSNQASRSTYLSPSSGQLAPSTEFAMQSPQTVPSTGMQAPSNQMSGLTEEWTTAGKMSSSANKELSPSQLVQPSAIITPPSRAVSQATPSLSRVSYTSRGISRRTIVLGLAGLAVVGVVGGGFVLLERSQQSAASPSSTPPPRLLPMGTTLYTYRGHSDVVLAVAWSPDGKRIASGGDDQTVQVWDAANGGNVYTYRGHSQQVWAVVWSPNGKRIASGSTDETVQVWDAANGGNVYTYRGHSAIVNAVAWSPDGKRIASGSTDETVQVWDAANGGNVYTYRGHSNTVIAVVWSPNGKRIASGGNDNTVQVWDAANGGNVFTYRGHSSPVYAVAWSPDGRHIASGGLDNTMQVWDAANGGHVFTSHTDFVHSVTWSPDGKRIASGGGYYHGTDHTVQVWDATNGRNIYTYRKHSDEVTRVAWSPDGRRIASGSDDRTVQVWVAE
jgi:WD40 repeat protein